MLYFIFFPGRLARHVLAWHSRLSDLCRRLKSSSLEATLKSSSFHTLLTLLHFISKSNLTLCQRQSIVSVHKFTSCKQPRQWKISVLGPCNRGLFIIRIIIQHFCFSVSPPRVCIASLRRCSLVLNGPCRVAKKRKYEDVNEGRGGERKKKKKTGYC